MGCDQSTEAGQRWRRTYAMDFNAQGPTRRFDYAGGSAKSGTKAAEQNAINASNNISGMTLQDGGGRAESGGPSSTVFASAEAAANTNVETTAAAESESSSRNRDRERERERERKKKKQRKEKFNESSAVFKSDVSYGGGNLWNENSHKLVSDEDMKKLKVYRMTEVAAHNSEHDAWMVIHNVIYDVTQYLPTHPGGAALVLGLCGRDATQAFSRSHANQQKAEDTLRKSTLIKKVGRIFTLNDSFADGGGNGSRQGSRQGSQRSSFSDRAADR